MSILLTTMTIIMMTIMADMFVTTNGERATGCHQATGREDNALTIARIT